MCWVLLGVLVRLVAFLGTPNHGAVRPGGLLMLVSQVHQAPWCGLDLARPHTEGD